MTETPGRPPVWTVEPSSRERVSCWAVDSRYLVLSATRGNGNDGGTITLAIQRTPAVRLAATRADATGYSGPEDDDDDGA